MHRLIKQHLGLATKRSNRPWAQNALAIDTVGYRGTTRGQLHLDTKDMAGLTRGIVRKPAGVVAL